MQYVKVPLGLYHMMACDIQLVVTCLLKIMISHSQFLG